MKHYVKASSKPATAGWGWLSKVASGKAELRSVVVEVVGFFNRAAIGTDDSTEAKADLICVSFWGKKYQRCDERCAVEDAGENIEKM